MAGETEVETPAQPEVTEEKKEIAEAENKTEEKKGGHSIAKITNNDFFGQYF